MEVKSTCGAVKLLSAIFRVLPGKDQDRLKEQYGLPRKRRGDEHFCRSCGQSYEGGMGRRYCKKCQLVTVLCDECGEPCLKSISTIIYWIGKRGQQHCFCSNTCKGRYMGRHYGFGAHPEYNQGRSQKDGPSQEGW